MIDTQIIIKKEQFKLYKEHFNKNKIKISSVIEHNNHLLLNCVCELYNYKNIKICHTL